MGRRRHSAAQTTSKSNTVGSSFKAALTRPNLDNEVDVFSTNREYVDLDIERDEAGSSEDDPLDRDTILDLDISASEGDCDDDKEEQESNDDHIEDAEGMVKYERRQKNIRSESAIATAWGKKRNIYYGSEAANFEIDSESDDEAKEEEAEALRQQSLMFAQIDEADYGSADLAAVGESIKPARMSAQHPDAIIPDPSSMTSDEKLRHIAKDSPELLGLINELTKTIHTLREKVSDSGPAQVAATMTGGVSLLSVQHHLLMQYCVTLLFYLLMKAEGRPVRSHPVIPRLITIRSMIERIQPIRSKIQYMLDKIQRQQPSSSDPLRFKPNTADDTIDHKNPEHEQLDGLPSNNRLYVPPRHRMVEYDEGGVDAKTNRQEERNLKKLHKSDLMRTLRDEFSSAPEQQQTHDGSEIESDDEREKRQFEEENFLRLSRSSKKKKKTNTSIQDAFDDFQDIDHLLGKKDSDDDDDDEFQALRRAKSRAKSSVLDNSVQKTNSNATFDDLDDDDFDFYAAAQKKASKAAQKKKDHEASKRPVTKVTYVDDIADGRRGASKKMTDNRGIKRYRNKEDKNPRVKHRKRFEKAMVKRKSLVKEFSEKHNLGYGGEATGIKSNISRSVSLK